MQTIWISFWNLLLLKLGQYKCYINEPPACKCKLDKYSSFPPEAYSLVRETIVTSVWILQVVNKRTCSSNRFKQYWREVIAQWLERPELSGIQASFNQGFASIVLYVSILPSFVHPLGNFTFRQILPFCSAHRTQNSMWLTSHSDLKCQPSERPSLTSQYKVALSITSTGHYHIIFCFSYHSSLSEVIFYNYFFICILSIHSQKDVRSMRTWTVSISFTTVCPAPSTAPVPDRYTIHCCWMNERRVRGREESRRVIFAQG